MKIDNLFEAATVDIDSYKPLTSKRTHRLTIKALLDIRKQREKRKIDALKDMELYYQMYGNSGSDDGGMGF